MKLILLECITSVQKDNRNNVYKAIAEFSFVDEDGVQRTDIRKCTFESQDEAMLFAAEQFATFRQAL